MFVRQVTIVAMMAGPLAGAIHGPSFANDTETREVPLELTIRGVRAGEVPLYVSIQTRDQYRSMQGQGCILQETSEGDLVRTFKLSKGGEYAVSLWHDLDDDGRFSMTETYEFLDGWGSSGDVPIGVEPTFDTAKISVPDYGGSTTVNMIYPTD